MSRFRGTICPKVEQVIERLKRAADGWTPTWHVDDAFNIFSVTNGINTFEVNLQRHYYACRKWALRGIPRVHAIVGILHNKVEVDPFDIGMKPGFFITYSYIVLPSNGPRLWPATNGGKTNPPIMRKALGRPKKKTIMTNDEPTSSNVLSRNLNTIKCKSCGTLGHNSRTFKGKIAVDRQLEKGSNKVNKIKKQRNTSTKESAIVLTQGSQENNS
ncbi:hypothetical protein KIW84_051639 [Lathyrus oleraceus]|uniref:Uncharacterized protein n=1 Tax=Pisum sativum TaxID=3888 RepID=A0A9D5ADX0_PEA|nr:hypothetical protein KIW84_051639 [Pisum sativum]